VIKGPLERVLIQDGAQVHLPPVDGIDHGAAQDGYVVSRDGGNEG
jgi:hypothetical protein